MAAAVDWRCDRAAGLAGLAGARRAGAFLAVAARLPAAGLLVAGFLAAPVLLLRMESTSFCLVLSAVAIYPVTS
ncbi:MAG: hypothetical protein KJO85_02925 [Gammaproteobacteria bacterium]|nr:hypothetical protein [Gammaproteobacteria bacterium]